MKLALIRALVVFSACLVFLSTFSSVGQAATYFFDKRKTLIVMYGDKEIAKVVMELHWYRITEYDYIYLRRDDVRVEMVRVTIDYVDPDDPYGYVQMCLVMLSTGLHPLNRYFVNHWDSGILDIWNTRDEPAETYRRFPWKCFKTDGGIKGNHDIIYPAVWSVGWRLNADGNYLFVELFFHDLTIPPWRTFYMQLAWQFVGFGDTLIWAWGCEDATVVDPLDLVDIMDIVW